MPDNYAPRAERPIQLRQLGLLLALMALLVVSLGLPDHLCRTDSWRALAGKGHDTAPARLFVDESGQDWSRWALLIPGEAAAPPAGLDPLADPAGVLAAWAGPLPEGWRIAPAAIQRRPTSTRLRGALQRHGRALDGAEILIDLAATGAPLLIRAPWRASWPAAPPGPPPAAPEEELLAAARDWLAESGTLSSGARIDSLFPGAPLWRLDGDAWQPVREVWALVSDPPGDWRLLLTEHRPAVVAATDRLIRARSAGGLIPPHSTGRTGPAPARSSTWVGAGRVFDPNPIVTSGDWDLRWGDPVDAWTFIRPLEELDGSGWLRGTYAWISTGLPARLYRPDLRFILPGGHPGREEVMAYYHLTRAAAELDRIGWLPESQPFHARVHATPQDNSWYRPSTGMMEFGYGGVPDALDADILLHELGHALHDRLVPGFGGGETRALSEGFADYLACAQTGDPCLGEWDATAYAPPCLRHIATRRIYPGDMTGRPHTDGLIWSGALWALRESLPAELVDRLALEALAGTSPWSTLGEAAEILAERAAAHDGGRPGPTARAVRAVLEDRGLLQRRGTTCLQHDEELCLPLAFPFPAGERLAWGVVVSGAGIVTLHDLPCDRGRRAGTALLEAQPLRRVPPPRAGWRVTYAVDEDRANLQLEQLTGGIVGARGWVALFPDGAVRIGWGGEGEGAGGRRELFVRLSDAAADTIDIFSELPCELDGLYAAPDPQRPLAEGCLGLIPVEGGEASRWTADWERPPVPPPPGGGSTLRLHSPAGGDIAVSFRLARAAGELRWSVVDVRGRRIAGGGWGARPAGLYREHIAAPAAAGCYFVELLDGARRLGCGRFVILR
ncbi:MAG: hypothetical protein GF355_09240 [Candidatus Eisenbacteria bacterium]|nr:hypothetical protein [Candidatus Eisenbacteria bacterium]